MNEEETYSTEQEAIARLCLLETYAGTELDPSDEFGFLSICKAFKITEKNRLETDSEAVEIMLRLKNLCIGRGLAIDRDFEGLLGETREREELESIEKENDRLEIEFAQTKEKLAAMYVQKTKLEELRKEKAYLEQKLNTLEKTEKLSSVSQEAVRLAESLSVATKKEPNGKIQPILPECVEEFHALFLPFVSLSVDAVNFLYSQLVVDASQATTKQQAILEYISHVKGIQTLRDMRNHSSNLKKRTDSAILEILIDRKSIEVETLCTLTNLPREKVIERVFFLSAKNVIRFQRIEDRVSF
ncbi:hypothetical protein NEDG_00970 [Nematocida displodere]|uniref:Uncharacterized protein n=1 Tax=Nematocida displodere TaxID=1805483 RepID=A0A177EBF0_9MICR|nr:hypothetical protein NEDG_00970 [Nematocida displodere]